MRLDELYRLVPQLTLSDFYFLSPLTHMAHLLVLCDVRNSFFFDFGLIDPEEFDSDRKKIKVGPFLMEI